jgi:hypothetical protein
MHIARDALRHPWLSGQIGHTEFPLSNNKVLSQIKKYHMSKKLKKVALKVIATEVKKHVLMCHYLSSSPHLISIHLSVYDS